MTYEPPTLETYGGIETLTEIVDGTYGGGPLPPTGADDL